MSSHHRIQQLVTVPSGLGWPLCVLSIGLDTGSDSMVAMTMLSLSCKLDVCSMQIERQEQQSSTMFRSQHTLQVSACSAEPVRSSIFRSNT